VSEVQGEGNVTVLCDVSLKKVLKDVTVYSDFRLRYRMRELLLCTLMCV